MTQAPDVAVLTRPTAPLSRGSFDPRNRDSGTKLDSQGRIEGTSLNPLEIYFRKLRYCFIGLMARHGTAMSSNFSHERESLVDVGRLKFSLTEIVGALIFESDQSLHTHGENFILRITRGFYNLIGILSYIFLVSLTHLILFTVIIIKKEKRGGRLCGTIPFSQSDG